MKKDQHFEWQKTMSNTARNVVYLRTRKIPLVPTIVLTPKKVTDEDVRSPKDGSKKKNAKEQEKKGSLHEDSKQRKEGRKQGKVSDQLGNNVPKKTVDGKKPEAPREVGSGKARETAEKEHSVAFTPIPIKVNYCSRDKPFEYTEKPYLSSMTDFKNDKSANSSL
uniref:Triadin-like n=1 Tax=Rhabditophanes sp. KR3021 TaxID=114890 RepID=A0AC35TMS6_9BILA